MAASNKDWELTIGIECHVQLKTKTKLFSGAPNDDREAEPNTKVSPICFGLPGVLPYLNERAVELAIRAGLALNAQIAGFTKFDRKHYYYPDLPKGYQVTQFDKPIVGQGKVEVPLGDKSFTVRITRAHLEEDAGKSVHPDGVDYSLVDLNRAGTPLLEIVSEPDMHSAEEARAYAHELYLLMKYADVSDVNLYYGNMRFDVNVSVAKFGSDQLGTRTETKNLNSFRSVEAAVNYEFKRQVELLEKGQEVVQETRGWDEGKQKTVSQRSKEDAHDYRYFPEPDIPPLEISPKDVQAIKVQMPKLPNEIREELAKAGINRDSVETLLEYPDLINKLIAEQAKGADGKDLKRIADWFVNVMPPLLSATPGLKADEYFEEPGNLLKLSQMVEEGKVSSTGAKSIIETNWTNFLDPEILAKNMDLLQQSDEGELEAIVDRVLAVNQQAAEDVKNGEMKAIGFLVGQIMKESKGAANPQVVQKIIRDKLGVK